jgi:hypothetical protein
MRLRFAGDTSTRVPRTGLLWSRQAPRWSSWAMGLGKTERHEAAVTMHARTFQLDPETFPSPLPSATNDKQLT